MNTTTKIFTFLLCAALLLIAACDGAPSDDSAPSISNMLLDGNIAPVGGDHELGTILPFRMTLEDNRGLEEFQVQVNGILDDIRQIEGTSTSVDYSFTVDANYHMVGDSIYLVFIAEDEFGNIGFKPYSMLVVE